MTGFIMSKSSQQVPASKPDPLFQYPERYSQEESDHQERYQRLKAAGHRVGQWKDDPSGLKAYEDATKDNEPETDEQNVKRLAGKKKDIEFERDHGEMRPKGPEQYDEASQTEPPADATPVDPTSTPAAKTEPRLKDDPQQIGSAVERIKSLAGGYLTEAEQDAVQSFIGLGQYPHQIAAAINAKRRKALLQQTGTRPAFPTVGRTTAPRSSGPGSLSNAIIRQRNAGVPHQFESSIGGNAANYR